MKKRRLRKLWCAKSKQSQPPSLSTKIFGPRSHWRWFAAQIKVERKGILAQAKQRQRILLRSEFYGANQMPKSRCRKRHHRPRNKHRKQHHHNPSKTGIPTIKVTPLTPMEAQDVNFYLYGRCAICRAQSHQMLGISWRGESGENYACTICIECSRLPVTAQECDDFCRSIEMECDCEIAQDALEKAEVTG